MSIFCFFFFLPDLISVKDRVVSDVYFALATFTIFLYDWVIYIHIMNRLYKNEFKQRAWEAL